MRAGAVAVALAFAAAIVACASDPPDPIECRLQARCGHTSAVWPSVDCPVNHDCVAFPGCLTPICIRYGEACDAYCPPGDDGASSCGMTDSGPAQLDCDEEDAIPGVDPVSCDDLLTELESLQACSRPEQCGRVLEGTSCGCTRDLVGRLDLQPDLFEKMLSRAEESCLPETPCDCPEADGFDCVEGRCSWKYVVP